MSDKDLVIGEIKPESEEIADEVEYIDYSEMDYITAAYYALDAVESSNPMTKEGQRQTARIRRKCLRIIDHCITELYEQLFDSEEDIND